MKETIVKRLFAVSRNLCAFPGCQTPSVDETGTVLGEICHIKGQRPGASRYDPAQTDEERNSFENLILMCGTCHKKIDSKTNLATWTVERLLKLKQEHEKDGCGVVLSSDAVQPLVDQLTVIGDQAVISIGQTGGQTAHTIHNFGPAPRVLSEAAGMILTNVLRRFPPQEVSVTGVQGDAEAYSFANQIASFIRRSGWQTSVGVVQFYVPDRWIENRHLDQTKDITVVANDPDNPAFNVVAQWVHSLDIGGKFIIDEKNTIQGGFAIVVGSQSP